MTSLTIQTYLAISKLLCAFVPCRETLTPMEEGNTPRKTHAQDRKEERLRVSLVLCRCPIVVAVGGCVCGLGVFVLPYCCCSPPPDPRGAALDRLQWRWERITAIHVSYIGMDGRGKWLEYSYATFPKKGVCGLVMRCSLRPLLLPAFPTVIPHTTCNKSIYLVFFPI